MDDRLVRPAPDFQFAESFKDLERQGFVPCALGPVYVYAEVKESIPDRFAMEDIPGKPSEMRGMELRLERPILSHCMDWNYMLNIIDGDSFPYFKQWLLSQQFVNREKRCFYVVRHFKVPVKDPIALALGKSVDTALDVFTLSGFSGLLKPVISTLPATYTGTKDPKELSPRDEVAKRVDAVVPDFVVLKVASPEDEVIDLGKAALEIVDNA